MNNTVIIKAYGGQGAASFITYFNYIHFILIYHLVFCTNHMQPDAPTLAATCTADGRNSVG